MLGELAGMKCVRFVSDLAHLPRELKIQHRLRQNPLSSNNHTPSSGFSTRIADHVEPAGEHFARTITIHLLDPGYNLKI